MKNQNRCFISLVIKALEIKKKFKLYTSEKEYANVENRQAESDKCVHTKFCESQNSVLKARGKEKKHSFLNKILVEDSSEYFILKSVLGFLGGLFITYLCFLFLIFSLNFTLRRATYICIGLGIILSLGLAFSVKIRCTVFLCIPQLFSKRGRQALLAYAFILALSGPAKNTLHNVEVMSESLACTQEQLKQAENELSKCVLKPNAVARRSIEKLLEKINCAVKDFKHFILQLYKTCFDILQRIFQSEKWLYSITLLCQKKMGKPAHRCLKFLAETRENCEASIPFESWKKYCDLSPLSQGIICSVKEETVCTKSDLPEFLPVLKLQKQIKNFKHRAMNILYVSIESQHSYSPTNRSHTYHEEYQGMATEIRQKTDQFLQYFDVMSVIFGLFILVLFIKVIIYRYKFLTQDHFDNRYITNDFVDIDNTRAAFQMETLLPLTRKERMQYIKVWCIRLVPSERIQLLHSFVFLIFATFKIMIHMMTDSSLYWILSSVRREERSLYSSTVREDEMLTTVKVVGHGMVAALIQNVTTAVRKESSLIRLDPTPCLPDPVPPDWNRYSQIIALVIICWLLALCEPYGLRLRHAVMVTYHPDRARERAIWLYNRIISNRICFSKTSTRQLRRKYRGVEWEKTFSYKLTNKTSLPKCLLCETTIYSFDDYVKCDSVKCLGLYCAICFRSLKFCCICSDPANYGDLSDVSEEKDSSEEELPENKTLEEKDNWSCESEKERRVSLQLKKINSKEVICHEDKKKKCLCLERQEKQNFFLRALKHCRTKTSQPENLQNVSDVESSDWEHISPFVSERSSSENNVDKGEEDEKSSGSKLCGRCEKCYESKIEKGNLKTLVQKVCLFKKVSPSICANRNSNMSCESAIGTKDEACFVNDFQECAFDSSLDFVSSEKSKLRDVKDSLQLLRLKKKIDTEETFVKISKDKLICSAKKEEDEQFEKTEVFLSLLELGGTLPTRETQVFPFIDPINVHEFKLEEDSFKTALERLESQSSNDMRSCSGILKSGENFLSGKTAETVRLNQENLYSSDPENFKICLDEGTARSSDSDWDCEFYTEPYRPRNHLLNPESNDRLRFSKKISPKLNLTPKTINRGTACSVETDSSYDNFMSVKTARKIRKKPKKCKRTEKETVKAMKFLAESSQTVQSKRKDFFKAKIYQFCKKNLSKRKSSAEDGSSDIDNCEYEYTPGTAMMLSDKEFQLISKRLSFRKTDSERSGASKSSLRSPPCRK